MKCSRVYQCVEDKIGGFFARYGRFVAAHAWKVLIVSIIVNGVCGIFMKDLDIDNDARKYLPSGTQEEADLERMQKLFPRLDFDNFNALRLTNSGPWLRIIVRSKTGNLLTRPMLEEVQSLTNTINNITAEFIYKGNITSVQLYGICARMNKRCVVDGELFIDEEFLAAVDADKVTYPEFSTSTWGTVYYASNLGGKVKVNDSGRYLKSAEVLKLEFMMPFIGHVEWLETFKSVMDGYTNKYIDVAFGYYYSVNEELENNLTGDITLFGGTMALMIVYAFIATFSARATDQVGQRIWLGFAGILAAGLAIVSSIGLCSAAGVSFVTIVGVVPFLIIGIGIDDMFLLLSGLSEAQTKTTVGDKMAETLRVSGVGVTITSLTDLIAFMSGVGSEFVAVKNFCIYTGVAVVFCYLNNITFFAACVAINERRVAGNRHFMTCRKIKDTEDLREEGKSNCDVICCGGRAPTNREEAESFIDKLPRWLIPKIVSTFPCKVIILIMFIPYFAAAVYGCIYLKQGMPFTQLVSDDSYFYKYADWNEKYFDRQNIVTFVIPKTYDYYTVETQSMMDELITSVHANRYFDNTFEVNWLKSYKDSQYFDNTSSLGFYSGLKDFFSDPQYMVFLNDVVVDFNNSDGNILGSRVYFRSNNLVDTKEEGKMMLESRTVADAAAIDCFPYSPAFIIAELYVRIFRVTAQSVGIALASVFVITCIFMPHPVLIAFVTVAVASIMAGVVGYMLYLNVSLSAISMVMLIMSIGFSVDFTAHICHGYMMSDGETRAIRVKQAIDKTGAPIFHGAVSSLLGILVLAGAKSYIFRAFAAVMTLVLVFGITHALLLLPVILSWFGPAKVNIDDEVKKPELITMTTSNSAENDDKGEEV